MNEFNENNVNLPEEENTQAEIQTNQEPIYAQLYTPPVEVASAEKVEYSPISRDSENYKGIKFFAIIMAFVVAITGSCVAGYYIGKSSADSSKFSETTLNLEAKPTNTNEYSASQVFQIVDESIVGITVYNSSGSISTASGVVYTEDGYIITNDHIYSEITGAKFKVRFYDGQEYPAEFVAGDTRSDLAVLKIDTKGLTPAVFGDSSQIVQGENVVAVGRPNQVKDNCITQGIVSVKERRVTVTSSYSMKMIQTSAAINPGSSGGALVNMYGQVIGITSSKISSEVIEAIGFAIPSSTTKKIVESLIAYGCVNDRARLGISYQAIDEITKEIKNYNTTGIVVVSISDDSDLLGKINEGDIITHVNGTAITADDVILDIIESSKPDQKLDFTVYKSDGTTKNISAKLLPDTGSSSYTYSPIE